MAWTGNFKTQIGDLAGALSPSDDSAIQQWLIDGCYDVLSKAVAKNGASEVWKFCAKSSNQTSNDVDVDEIRTIAGVVRNGIFATKGEWALKGKYSDTDSIYAATDTSPVWYLDDSKLSIYPAPTGSEVANYYFVPEFALTSWDSSNSSINNYPSEYYYHVMLYAACQVLHRKMVDSVTPTVVPTLNITETAPSAPTIATVSYSSPGASNAASPTVSTSAYVLPSAGTAFSSRLADFSALGAFTVATGAPSFVSAPNITSPGVATVAKANIAGDVPTYNSVTVASGALGAMTAISFSQFTNTVVMPTAPILTTVSYTPPTAATMDSYTVTTAATPPVSVSGGTSGQSLLSAPTFIPPTPPTDLDLDSHLATMKTYVEDEEDPEWASSKAQEIQQRIADWNLELANYQAQLGEASSLYQQELAVYQEQVKESQFNVTQSNQITLQNLQKDLQVYQASNAALKDTSDKDFQSKQLEANNRQAKAMQDAIQQTQAIIQDNQNLLALYNAEMQESTSQFNNEMQAYQQNATIQTQLQNNNNQLRLQEHSQRVQNELNNFNEENTRYQANIQAELAKHQTDAQEAQKEADLTMQATIQDYTLELQMWSQQVSQYQAQVNKEVQEYQQNLQRELQTWQTEQANALQQYQLEATDNLNNANITNQAHLQKANGDLQVAIRNADKELERTIQNAVNTMNAIIQNNQSLIAKYQADLAVYQAEVNTLLQQNASNIQKFQVDVTKATTDYQWLQDQYARLKTEYNQAFAVAGPQQ